MSESSPDELVETSLPRARQPRVREIDFSRPSKFTTEQLKRLERAHEAYSRGMTNQLSAELRMPVELKVSNVVQHVWASALAEAANPSVFAVVGIRDQGHRFLFACEQ